jgi:hypothetical protein
MFDAPLSVDAERLNAAAREWATANYLRVALVLGCWMVTLIALMRLGSSRQTT